ncbi:hypothetical protein Tco_0742208 [Tanacetum coccineum]
MYYDSKSAIAISCNPVQHSCIKHINIHYHFIKKHIERGTVELYFLGTEYQLADLFTKALPKERFEYLVHRIVPWIYIQQVWHTLRLDDSKERFIFFIDTKEFTFLVDDLRRVFQLPQATGNNHARFIEPPTFTVMLLVFLNELGYATRICLPRQFATKDLSQLWNADSGVDVNGGTHGTPSTPRPPNPVEHQGELRAQHKPTVIRIQWRSQLDPEQPILTTVENDVTNLDEVTQMSINTARSLKDLEAYQNVKKVQEHLVDEEIKKIVEGNDDVDENQFVDDILNSQ